MALLAKKVLYINLEEKTYELKSLTDLYKYIGGVGIGIKLLQEEAQYDPIIFSTGPLNGFFPYASKTSVVLNSDGVIEDIYIGGTLSSRIKFAGLDSVVLRGRSEEPITIEIIDDVVNFHTPNIDVTTLGLPGKRSTLTWDNKDNSKTDTIVETGPETNEKKFLLDGYFSAPEKILEKKLLLKNIKGLSITGNKTIDIKDTEEYDRLYKLLLGRIKDMWIEPNKYPSCSGCPLGCVASKRGEIGGNIITHSLVACSFAEGIYSDLGITFACLNSLGYHYRHEDIQALPKLIDQILRKF